jgi:hypothetical protein
MSETPRTKPLRGLWIAVLCLGLLAVLSGLGVLIAFLASGEVYQSSVPGLIGALLGGGVCTFIAVYKLREPR